MNENIPIHPHVIGLTGGIASGKSSIAKRLENLGVFIVDCDALGHRAYLPGTKCFKDVLQAFGDEIKDANGTINRKALGSIVFSNRDALNKLNSIVWPQIAELAKAEIKKLRTEGKDIVVLDAVVLLEANWNKFCQEVWVAIIPPEEE
ncbi:bifunctional coenzyme A synthase-like isoform X2 [Artemia franciscana]|uniref:bifunctional coenzyme A synthase-like isoform X2 n=1 Tax=Artemia franciscana TaxID=6661 RepID=UPI0032DB3C3B